MRLQPKRAGGVAALAAAAIVAGAVPAAADRWNERTDLTFSSPVMVPGATLPAGAYVFQLANSWSDRHIVRIFTAEPRRLVTTARAVPLMRLETESEPTLMFNPTEPGAAPAIKAWFYPNSRYGHEFVYPESQAKLIAERTRTIVLSDEAEGGAGQATLRIYDASGGSAAWRGDDATAREWEEFRRNRVEPDPASAALVQAGREGTRIALDDLENDPGKYMGQLITVDAEIEDVMGPRVFTIDEPGWVDLDGEILVLLPTPRAAMVREDDRVTVTGRIQPFVKTDFQREWGWLDLEPRLEVRISRKPVLVAERIVGGDDRVAMVIDVADDRPVGTSGAAASPMTDASTLAAAGRELVGRHVALHGVTVDALARDHGFFVRAGERRLFVLPGAAGHSAVSGSDRVDVEGVVMRMPRPMRGPLAAQGAVNTDIYVFATSIDR